MILPTIIALDKTQVERSGRFTISHGLTNTVFILTILLCKFLGIFVIALLTRKFQGCQHPSFGPTTWHAYWSCLTKADPKCELVHISPKQDACTDPVYPGRVRIPEHATDWISLDVVLQSKGSSSCTALLHPIHYWQYQRS